MEVYGLVPDTTVNITPAPRPARPTYSQVAGASHEALAGLEDLVTLYEHLGRPRAHIDRLMDAVRVIESTLEDPRVKRP